MVLVYDHEVKRTASCVVDVLVRHRELLERDEAVGNVDELCATHNVQQGLQIWQRPAFAVEGVATADSETGT